MKRERERERRVIVGCRIVPSFDPIFCERKRVRRSSNSRPLGLARSIESYLSMEERYETEKETNRKVGRPPSYPNGRSQPRLSYADCSEQLDFNAGINPLPLNFILGE